MIPSRPAERPPSANDRHSGSGPTVASQRGPPSAWGPSTSQLPSTRRGLTPISTSGNPLPPRPTSSSHSPRNPWSPVNQLQTGSTSEARAQGRSSSISSATSPFSPPLPSSQPSSSQSYTSRSRTATNPSTSQLASVTASSQGGASGATTNPSTRYTRASPSLSQSNFNSSANSVQLAGSAAGQSGQLSKIVFAQLSLLLSTIKEDKDRGKWESQREQIRKASLVLRISCSV